MSIRYYISAVLLVLAAAGLALAWNTYQTMSQTELTNRVSGPAGAPDVDLAELERGFEDLKLDREKYAVIADKNLFSEQRRPALSLPGRLPNGSFGTLPPQLVEQIRPDVLLQGTAIIFNTRLALVRTPVLNNGRTEMVRVGSVLKDEARAELPYYTVISIEPQKVTLQDSRGEKFIAQIAEVEPDQAAGNSVGDDATSQGVKLPDSLTPQQRQAVLAARRRAQQQASKNPQVPAQRPKAQAQAQALAKQRQNAVKNSRSQKPRRPQQGAAKSGNTGWVTVK